MSQEQASGRQGWFCHSFISTQAGVGPWVGVVSAVILRWAHLSGSPEVPWVTGQMSCPIFLALGVLEMGVCTAFADPRPPRDLGMGRLSPSRCRPGSSGRTALGARGGAQCCAASPACGHSHYGGTDGTGTVLQPHPPPCSACAAQLRDDGARGAAQRAQGGSGMYCGPPDGQRPHPAGLGGRHPGLSFWRELSRAPPHSTQPAVVAVRERQYLKRDEPQFWFWGARIAV